MSKDLKEVEGTNSSRNSVLSLRGKSLLGFFITCTRKHSKTGSECDRICHNISIHVTNRRTWVASRLLFSSIKLKCIIKPCFEVEQLEKNHSMS